MTDLVYPTTPTMAETEPLQAEESFTARHVALSVIPHITGILSLLGSLSIVIDVVARRRFVGSVYHRLLLGLAVSDLMASIGFFLSTWPIPETSLHAWGALGNIQTCDFQGFMIQLGLATCLYNAFLSIYYVMLVRFNFKQESPPMLRFERVAHTVSVSLALGTAVASLALNLYNDANLWCWIAPHPLDCENSITTQDGVGTCVRGDNAWVYRMAFYFSWLWASFGVVVVSMSFLTWTVRQQWNKMNRYRFPAAEASSTVSSTNSTTTLQKGGNKKGSSSSSSADNKMRSVMIQAVLYIVSFILTALPVSVARLVQAKYNCTSTFFPLSLTTVTFFPLQGFWLALIYFRPKFLQYVEQKRRERLRRIAYGEKGIKASGTTEATTNSASILMWSSSMQVTRSQRVPPVRQEEPSLWLDEQLPPRPIASEPSPPVETDEATGEVKDSTEGGVRPPEEVQASTREKEDTATTTQFWRRQQDTLQDNEGVDVAAANDDDERFWRRKA